MDLIEFQRQITESELEDWTFISCWGAGSGPSFLDKLEVWTNGVGTLSNIEIDSHGNLMSFRSDLLISVAWGLKHNNDFREDWTTKFADRKASSGFVDFFYAKNLVFRDIYVAVDGGRCLLPLPDQRIDSSYTVTGLMVDHRRAAFFSLLNGHKPESFYDYIDRAGIELIDGRWML